MGAEQGIAVPLNLIMMMWESADWEKGLEHLVEGSVFHDFICHVKNSLIPKDMVRKHGYRQPSETNTGNYHSN